MKDILVIGGSGFIGTRLVRRLIEAGGYRVGIFDKRPSGDYPGRVQLGDVRSLEQLSGSISAASIIINLAAEHRDDVRPISLYDEVNVGGARNICSAARAKRVDTIVFTSSVAVYGFAPIGTDESGVVAPFNDYGRTKHLAELEFRRWQQEEPLRRSLVIIRPTVVFGERNRGNVFNLLRQIAAKRFVMVGKGVNRKSLAYVDNVAAFIEHSISFGPGVHVFNFVDKPDFTMNALVSHVMKVMGRSGRIGVRVPFPVAYAFGRLLDFMAAMSGRSFTISAIRVRKFCADSAYETSVERTGFIAPVPLTEALRRTVQYEFLEDNSDKEVFFSE